MSAVEDYRECWEADKNSHGLLVVRAADAAIAELEAENSTVIKRAADAIIKQEKRAEQAEAAIAELEAALAERDARRCEGCHYVCFDSDCQPFPWYCTCRESMLHDSVTDPDFACNRWAARAEEGSET